MPVIASPERLGPAGTCFKGETPNRLISMLTVGDKAPEFKLPTTGGHDLTLADALEKHKALVFLFYVLDFTGG